MECPDNRTSWAYDPKRCLRICRVSQDQVTAHLRVFFSYLWCTVEISLSLKFQILDWDWGWAGTFMSKFSRQSKTNPDHLQIPVVQLKEEDEIIQIKLKHVHWKAIQHLLRPGSSTCSTAAHAAQQQQQDLRLFWMQTLRPRKPASAQHTALLVLLLPSGDH